MAEPLDQDGRYSNAHDYIVDLLRDSYVYVHLEPTNACNADCDLCPRDAMHRRLQMMSPETFQKSLELLTASPVPMLAIVGFGEPTLHRSLPAMIQQARQERPDLAIKLTSNGSRLTKDRLDTLYDHGLDLLEISVFGDSPDAYEAEMAGMQFSHVRQLIANLNDGGHSYTLTTVRSGECTAPDLRDFWRGVGARAVTVKGAHSRGRYLRIRRPLSRDRSLGEYEPRELDALDGSPSSGCHKLHMFLHVNSLGNVVPCVQEINNKNVLASVDNLSRIDEALKVTRMRSPEFDICEGCELIKQDLVDAYARFFAGHFSERIGPWRQRLASFRDNRSA